MPIAEDKKYDSRKEQIYTNLKNLFEPQEGERWLHSQLTAFDGRRPRDLIDAGETDRVLQILTRLEEGIHA